MFPLSLPPSRARLGLLGCAFAALCSLSAVAGGPKYVAGVSYFNPAVLGQPIHWKNGLVNYYVDQGPLTASIDHQRATAMVDAAAALWSAVPTAAVTLTNQGTLNEDVNGGNIVAGILAHQAAQPADIAPSAAGYPLAVVFDQDGAVIDALYGAGASDPTSCQTNGVLMALDNINPDATIAHALILLNGRCASGDAMLQMMNYELARAFGRILGLDFAQVNPNALTQSEPGGTLGWAVMHPLTGVCSSTGGECVPGQGNLRYDDIASLNRIYPVTAQNLAAFPGKQLTAANTVSIRGTVSFRTGYGMQGVNVTARPLDANGNPLYQYAVTAVTGAFFNGKHGNPVTGWVDAGGNLLTMYGSNDASLQGSFDLSGIPLPPGVSSATYQITFEAINPLYILTDSVGPYQDGQVTPSGALNAVTLSDLAAGASQTVTVSATDSAAGGYNDAIGSETTPRLLAASGMWTGRLSQVGQTDWFTFPVRGGRTFTVVTQAVDESGAPSNTKAMPSIGIWDAFDASGATAIGAAPGLNGLAPGETWLQVSADADDIVRIGIADERGDGRPDYAYKGWVLYADTVEPLRLPASGGAIVIHGRGFRLTDTVKIGGQAAVVTSISPTEITAIAPPAASGVSGSVDVEVDDDPILYAMAVIGGGISYDSGTGDALTLVTAPTSTVSIGVPNPFTVTALGSDLKPAGGVTVIFTVVSGTATLACGLPTCSVVATGDGHATMNVTANSATWSTVTASLTNGSLLKTEFVGGTPASLTAITPQLSLAAGATETWTVQALVLNNGNPLAGQSVAWQTGSSGIAAQGATAAITSAAGIATQSLTVGPLTEGQTATIKACLNGTSQCVSFSAFGARPGYATLQAVSGISQSLAIGATPAQVTLRLLDMNGNPMAGGSVLLYQSLYAWTPPCATHGVCAAAQLLATQTAASVSALDGLVTFTPLSMPGVATRLSAVAVSGDSAALNVAVETHP